MGAAVPALPHGLFEQNVTVGARLFWSKCPEIATSSALLGLNGSNLALEGGLFEQNVPLEAGYSVQSALKTPLLLRFRILGGRILLRKVDDSGEIALRMARSWR